MNTRSTLRNGSIAALLLLLTPAARLDAAATLLKEGELSYSVNVGYITASKFLDQEGDRQDIGCRAEYGEYLHSFEYGYSKFYTWLASAGLGVTGCDGPGDQGLDDVKLGFRAALTPSGKTGKSAVTVMASIPTDPDAKNASGPSRLSCGTFSVSGMVDRADPLSERTVVSYGAGLQLNEAPLSHQATAQLSFANLLSERWGVVLGVSGNAPITQLPEETDSTRFLNSVVAQCGTQSTALNATLGLQRKLSKAASASCGGSYTVLGEQVTQALGVFCGYSYTWR